MAPFGLYLVNTIIVVAVILFFQLLTMTTAAYAFARLEFRGSNFLYAVYHSNDAASSRHDSPKLSYCQQDGASRHSTCFNDAVFCYRVRYIFASANISADPKRF